jgi:TP901 family phage tail tape measure protein
MASQIFELGILISLKDAASSRVDGVTVKLRELGKEGKVALKQFDELKRDLAKGFALGGVGVAGLASMRGGVKTAGDFEAAMADLRLSIEEVGGDGRINFAKLNDEMNRFEKLGMDLGNVLPGTTQDFIEMFSTLKQGGLSAQTILDGTGQAVAHLAVITNQLPKGLAEPFAQYVQQFKLTGKEATQLADVLAKLKFSTGLSPQELIEGSKFFQLRVGTGLGMTGLQGAEQGGRLLATLRRAGLEGGIGGRELAGMFGEMTFARKEQRDQLAALRGKGIDLQFFDKKGGFLGIENVFAQMEKLRGLAPKARMEVLEKLFNKEAAGPANIMIDAGSKGWKETNAEIDRGTQLQDKINEKVATFNAKLEAVQGTFSNLVATTFTPMLDTLKPVLDTTNSVAGAIQEWAKEHQTTASVATHLFGVGSAALVLIGGLKSLIAAWRIWKFVSAVGSGEAGLLSFLKRFRTETDSAGTGATAATTKVGGLRGALSRIPSAVKISIGLIGIEYAISRISDVIHEMRELAIAQEGMANAAAGGEKIDAMARKAVADLRAAGKTKEADTLEAHFNAGANSPGARAEEAMRQLSNAGQIFGLGIGGWDLGADAAKKFAPGLSRPDVMAEFLKRVRSGSGASASLDANDRAILESNLRAAFPDSFRQATEALEQSLKQAEPQVNQTSQAIKELRDASQSASTHLRDLATVPASGATGGTPLTVPGAATGGHVRRTGLALIHAGETVVPARVSPLNEPREQIRFRPPAAAANAGNTTVHLHVHPPAGSAMANDPKAFAQQALEYVTHQVRRQRERR